jgi:Ca-activated chloride channel family protein
MSFLWPQALWLLAILPIGAVCYLLLLRRRKKNALRHATLGVVREALGRRRLRRHVPAVLLGAGLIATILAVARPTATITLPSEQRTIIMAIDVSLSMRANDVEPTRIAAAQSAAKAFIQQQPEDVRIGIVSFAGTAALVQPPTRDKDDLAAAIDRFELQRHTAIGSGMLVSLAALFPDDEIDIEKAVLGGITIRDQARGRSVDAKSKPAKRLPPKAVPPGSYPSGAIVLLTDGRRTTGPDPLEIARMAADRGVRIFTVGFGRADGGMASVDGYSMFMAFDETTLKSIAELTRADYYHASSADELTKVYDTLTARFQLEKKQTEITSLVAALAAAIIVAAAALSVAWFGGIV